MSLGEVATGGRSGPVVGVVLVSRGDEGAVPDDSDDIPQLERLRALLAGFGAGGCGDLYVALGSRVVQAPRDSSTAFYVPEWYDALDETVGAALTFAAGIDGVAGVLVQTIDSQDLGDVGVARVLDAAAGRPEVLVRALCHGHLAQPVYVGAGLLTDVSRVIAGSGGAVRYLREHAGEVVTVDCSDLAGPVVDVLG